MQSLYAIAWLKLKLLIVAVFVLIKKKTGEFNCHKNFDSFLSYITAANKLKYKWITYLMNILYHTKKCEKCDFLNEGTFIRTSSVQDLPVILK